MSRRNDDEDFFGTATMGGIYFWWTIICVVGLTYFMWDL
jgi:hypothetical protein